MQNNTKHLLNQILNLESKYRFLILIPVLMITAAIYYHLAENKLLISWTDQAYIIYNQDIKELSFENIRKIFTTFFMDNYHPLTNLSNAIEYRIFGLNPVPYHINNLLIHMMNTVLVFVLFNLLDKRVITSAVAALIFAIHPMHVESVAWASERKDMLYTFSYLSSIIVYIYYLQKENKNAYFLLSLFLFLISLLCKSAAVSLAPMILLIDLYFGRKIDKKLLIEKIPYFALSLFFGILALISQKSFGAMDMAPQFPVYDRIFLTSYVIMFYIFKFFVPIKLANFHPYPLKENGWLPVEFYLAFVALILIVVLVYFSSKNRKNLLTGLFLYFIPIALVLQIIPAGRTIVAERFSYVSYLGMIFLSVKAFDLFSEKNRKFYFAIIGIYAAVFCYVSFNRVKVWKDSYTLFNDVSIKYPYSYYAFWNKANSRYLEGNYKEALPDYEHALKLNPADDDSYLKIGNIHYLSNDFESSLNFYKKALANNPENEQAYNNIALSLQSLNKNEEALSYFDKAVKLRPKYVSAVINRGILKHKLKDYSGAANDFTTALTLAKDNADVYARRGMARSENGELTAALDDFTASLKIKQNEEVYVLRGKVYFKLKDFNKAITDYTQAIYIKPDFGMAWFERGNAKYEMKWKNEACTDWKKAYRFQYAAAYEKLNAYCRY